MCLSRNKSSQNRKSRNKYDASLTRRTAFQSSRMRDVNPRRAFDVALSSVTLPIFIFPENDIIQSR